MGGALELYSRLGNHRPFLQGEIRHFLREFEGKRGDREVEKIFGVLERVSELRDCGLPQLVERASGGEAAKLVGALQVSLSMVDRVQRQAETGEVEATLAASRLPMFFWLIFSPLSPERQERKSGRTS